MEIKDYSERFQKMNDAELLAEAQRLIRNPGIVQARINYQGALQNEIANRGLEWPKRGKIGN